MDTYYIQKVLEGDPDAFRYFIQQYSKMALSVAMAIVKDQQAAEECVQDSFIKAYKGLAGFNQQSKFSSWLYSIVKNESLYYLKRINRQPIEFIESLNDQIADEDYLLQLENEAQRDLIQQALYKLPAQENIMLSLFYLEQFSIKEMSIITGKTNNNIKVILHRARKHFLIIIEGILNKK